MTLNESGLASAPDGKIAGAVRLLGWRNGLLYLISRGLETLTGGRARLVKYCFVAQPVPASQGVAAPSSSRIKVSRIQPQDPLVQSFPRPRSVIERRFAGGAACFSAARDDKFVGYIWIQLDRYMEDEVRCLYRVDAGGNAGWDFDVYVEPPFRMGRTFARLWGAANDYLRHHGCRWTISRISVFNPNSFVAHRRLGLRHLHTGTFLVLGPVQLALFSCPPYFHLAFTRSQFPTLKLSPPAQPQGTQPSSQR